MKPSRKKIIALSMNSIIVLCMVIYGVIYPMACCCAEVIAVYDKGVITRHDLDNLIDGRYAYDPFAEDKKGRLLADDARMRSFVKNILYTRIAVAEAKKINLDIQPAFQIESALLVKDRLKYFLYDQGMCHQQPFAETVVRVSQIVLKPEKGNPNKNTADEHDIEEPVPGIESALKQAKVIIKKLDQGESFDRLAEEYSVQYASDYGSDRGYLVPGMVRREYADIVFSMPMGGYNREPLQLEDTIYILKVTERFRVTEKDLENLDSLIARKDFSKIIHARLKDSAINRYLDVLKASTTVKYAPQYVLKGQKDDVIFIVNGNRYTLSALAEARGIGPKEILDKRVRGYLRKIADDFFSCAVMEQYIKEKRLDMELKYKNRIQLLKDQLLTWKYLVKIRDEQISVTEEDIRREYEKNKNTRYAYTEIENGRAAKRSRPLEAVREEIAKKVRKTHETEFLRIWRENVLKAHRFEFVD